MREPLILPVAALGAGLLAARYAEFRPAELLAAIAGLSLLASASLRRGFRGPAALGCLAALVLAGTLLAVAHRRPPAPELDAAARELLVFSGCVVEPPALSEDREQLVLELEPGARARVNFYDDVPPELSYGQSIEFEGRARRTHNFLNPGAFDHAGYLARRSIYWTVSARRGAPVRVLGQCGSRFWRFVYGLRTAALGRIERLYRGDPYRTGMMQALLIGESARLDRLWIDDYRRTGTYHALVISGLHVTVLAAVFLFVLRLGWLGETAALLLTTALAFLYALVTGWQAPVVRAAAGFALYVAGRYFYRRLRLLNLLAAAALGFILIDPEQIFEASFQLSFLAVAAIGALALPLLEATSTPLARGLSGLSDRDRDLKLPPRVAHFRVELRLLAETVSLWTRAPARWVLVPFAGVLRAVFFVFELAAVSATVQAGLALPMAVYFHRLSLSGLTANIAVVPLTSLAVPVGFAAVFTGWSVPAALAGVLLEWSRRVVEWHAGWEPNWRIPGPPLWLALVFTAALLAFGVSLRGPRIARYGTGAVAAALLALIVWHPFPPAVVPGRLELTAIDVGQGESLFVAFPDGKLMLVDGGGFPAIAGRRRPQLDIGEDVVSTYLWSRSIRRLDVIAVTHGHEDHISGVHALIENFRPRELWTGALPAGALPGRAVPLRVGRRFEFGGARIEVLAPAADYQPGPAPQNNDSLVLRIAYGRHTFLLTGDIERRVEAELIGRTGRVDVLKVAHHGSRSSTGARFLEETRPAFAMISAGFENPYNLPHPELIGRLEDRRTAVLRTDRDGLVTIRSDGRRLEVESARLAAEPAFVVGGG